MNDKTLIILLKAILDIGDGKRKCREWLTQLEKKEATLPAVAPALPPVPPAAKPAGGKP